MVWPIACTFFAEEEIQIVPDQTAPLGAVWSGTILFALSYLVLAIRVKSMVLEHENKKTNFVTVLCRPWWGSLLPGLLRLQDVL